ncbi:hypothetical protein IE53DRAFT_58176 [Violaceomyces palustris]|uniref:Uncharacterized protein n=1 Tax=Violaceomyces palustris TaxID=1673888 RepID=A0ACD0NZS3_9BASI|nr:hypothetical protein IE53DRAFT_58176 [Violaceomyces palustris]
MKTKRNHFARQRNENEISLHGGGSQQIESSSTVRQYQVKRRGMRRGRRTNPLPTSSSSFDLAGCQACCLPNRQQCTDRGLGGLSAPASRPSPPSPCPFFSSDRPKNPVNALRLPLPLPPLEPLINTHRPPFAPLALVQPTSANKMKT